MAESTGAPYSDDLPEFFQIYLPSTWSQRMKIPPAFIKNFDGIVPVFVTLKTSSQLSWQVTTNKIDKNWYFEKGWPEFVQENSLKKWDFLTFCYDGNSSFYVNIFAINGIKKRASLQENEASDLPAVKRKKYEEKRGRGRPKRKVAKPLFFPEFFKVFLPQSLASQKIVIPADFIKHFNRRIQEKIILKDVEGKVWHVGVERSSLYDEVFIKGGWHNFVCNHYLEVGDFLVFKYVGSYSFLVKMFGPNGCKKEAFASKNIAVKIEQGTEEEENEPN